MNRLVRLMFVPLLLGASELPAATLYVSASSKNPRPPYATWATAATNIQQAVDAAAAGDEAVVANGVYGPLGVGKPLAVRSVNGAQSTVIKGGAGLAPDSSLSGFTLQG